MRHVGPNRPVTQITKLEVERYQQYLADTAGDAATRVEALKTFLSDLKTKKLTETNLGGFLAWLTQVYGLPPTGGTFLNQVSLGFDLSVPDLYLALTRGGVHRRSGEGARRDPARRAGRRAWVPNSIAETVSRIDVRTGRVVATVHTGARPYAAAWGFGSVWIANANDGTARSGCRRRRTWSRASTRRR